MTANAIEVRSVSKTFRLPHERRDTLREYFLHPLKRVEYEGNEALKGVSFDVLEGECFGIIGPNGSGKSTLMKLIAGIYHPDTGGVTVEGRLSPFIELGVGFNPELTGRENVRINATLLGLSRAELQSRFDAIVEFAELERFIDQKLKNYSSGMQLRLAYSIAIHVEFDILLLDEVLAVGDRAFQHKCFRTFESFRQDGKTVVFVSHDLESVRRVCDRVMLVERGEMVGIGATEEILEFYEGRTAPSLPTATSSWAQAP